MKACFVLKEARLEQRFIALTVKVGCTGKCVFALLILIKTGLQGWDKLPWWAALCTGFHTSLLGWLKCIYLRIQGRNSPGKLPFDFSWISSYMPYNTCFFALKFIMFYVYIYLSISKTELQKQRKEGGREDEETGRERKRDLQFLVHVPKWPQYLNMDKANVRSQELHSLAIFCLLGAVAQHLGWWFHNTSPTFAF